MANPLYDALFGRHLGQATVFLQMQDGTTLTHGQFLQQAAQYAHVLTNFGLTPGDRVAVQIEKFPAVLGHLCRLRASGPDILAAEYCLYSQ
jgi:malonyl-CoA/methylmalonyl-CoA synthetase